MNKKITIFDADSMVFTVAYRFRDKKAKHLVTMNLNKYISDVLSNSGATHFIGFYGSADKTAAKNFRYSVYPEYKANRPPTPEFVTKWRPDIHEEMSKRWGFVPVEGMEADDAVSISAKHFKDLGYSVTVATEDKDLKQVPGVIYYNFKKHNSVVIGDMQGHRFLAQQTLSGDPGDHIPGLPGIGPKKAENFVADCETVYSLIRTVMKVYRETYYTFLDKTIAANKPKVEDVIEAVGITADELSKEYSDKGINLSDKQIERKLKMLNKTKVVEGEVTDVEAEAAKAVADAMEFAFPGGWKNYMKMNHTLVRMLTKVDESPVEFNIPEPQESPLKKRQNNETTVEDAKKVLFGDDSKDEETDCPFSEDATSAIEATPETVYVSVSKSTNIMAL